MAKSKEPESLARITAINRREGSLSFVVSTFGLNHERQNILLSEITDFVQANLEGLVARCEAIATVKEAERGTLARGKP